MVTEVDLNSTVSSIPVLMDTLPGTSENQLKPVNLAVTSVTTVTASNDGACRSNHQDEAMVTSVTDKIITLSNTPKRKDAHNAQGVHQWT